MAKFRKRAQGRYLEKPKKNEEIRFPRVKVVSPDGPGVEEMSTQEALSRASSLGLDLVLITKGKDGRDAGPPLCKIIDYGKFMYEQKKKDNERNKKQVKVEVKGVRLTFNMDSHDLEVRIQQAKEFIEEKNHVKATMQLRGRELSHIPLAIEKMKKFVELMAEVAKVEKDIQQQGRQMSVQLSPLTKKHK